MQLIILLMSYKIKIILIIILSLITIGLISFMIINESDQQVAINSNQRSETDSTIKSQVISNLISAQISSSSVISSAQKVAESVKAESQDVTPNNNNPKVTYLDSKNPPQYINDYFECKNLIRDRSGIFVSEDNTIKYKCPPEGKCPQDGFGWRYNYDTQKWVCVGSFDESNLCPFYYSLQTESNFEHKAINDKIFTSGLLDSNRICLVITKTNFSEKEVKILQEKYNSVDFIIFNPSN
jgi:hypothetical protein